MYSCKKIFIQIVILKTFQIKKQFKWVWVYNILIEVHRTMYYILSKYPFCVLCITTCPLPTTSLHIEKKIL